MEERYAKVAEFYNDTYYRDCSSEVTRPSRHLRRLVRKLDVQVGARCLDVACGTGNWLSALKLAGAQVSGIDISASAIDVCRKILPDSDFSVGPAEKLPFPDQYFDLVSCLGSLEHFLDQPAALTEMVRVVRPGGRVLILVPNSGFITYKIGLYRGTYQQSVRETIRPLSEWDQMFRNCGLCVEKRWRDLHIISLGWIVRAPWYLVVPRLLQALALLAWPIGWQYQVYHLCSLSKGSNR